jgi:putative membrane protein
MKNLKMIKFVMVSAVALLFATACTNNTKTENNTNPSTEQTAKENQYTSNASFYLGKDGKAIQEKDIDKNATIVNWYVDPYCPACVQLEELTKDTIKEYINNKNVVIKYNVLSFLSARTVDDYSNRAAGWILGVINERPDLAYDYFTNVLSVNFHPNGKAKEDSAFKDLFIKLGGKEDEWKNIESKQKDLIEEVKSNTIRVFNDNELAKKSPTGKLFTPFIIVGGSEKAIDFEHGDNPLEQLKKEIDSKLK